MREKFTEFCFVLFSLQSLVSQFKNVSPDYNKWVFTLIFSLKVNLMKFFWRRAKAPYISLFLTISLRARVFYEQIVNEAQPSWLSLVENSGS